MDLNSPALDKQEILCARRPEGEHEPLRPTSPALTSAEPVCVGTENRCFRTAFYSPLGGVSLDMSPDDENAAIARIVKDRAEAKRQRALLESELQAGGKALHVISEALPLLGSPVVNIPVLLKLIDENAELLAPSKLTQMMKDYADLTNQIADLDAKAKAAGID